ncbi:MAG TPA: histidine kinase [Terriglobales bacterium]|nr:histidine kinase [Terriglobales bacterium]
MSRELHDETGQAFMLLRLQLSMLSPEAQNRDWQERVKDATALLDRTIAGLRRIIGRLSPRALEELGLTGAIRKEARELSKNTGIGTRLSFPGQFGDLDPEVEMGGRVRISRSKAGGTRLRIALPVGVASGTLKQAPVGKVLMRRQTMRQAG